MPIIKPKRSETASSVPTTSDIVAGEMAINVIDKKIYVRDSSNNIIEVANYTAGGMTGSDAQVDSDLNTSTATTNQILSWDGSNYDWIDESGDNQKVFTASGSISAGDVVGLNANGTVSSGISANWIGIAAESIADTATGKIDLPGAINSNQSGLSIGSIYYLDVNGQLTSSSTLYGTVGRALSSTELQIFERNHEYYSTYTTLKDNSYSLLLAIR